MAWRGTIVMVAVAIGLALVAALSFDVVSERPNAASGGPLLDHSNFPVSDLNRIELARGDEKWVFVREGDDWWQEYPFRVPIEGRNLIAVAERAIDVQVVDRFTPTEELSLDDLDLDSPPATLVFGWDGGSRRLEFGRRGVAGRGYLRMDDDPTVLVINQALHTTVLDSDPTTWRDPLLFPGFDIEGRQIRRIVGDREIVLNRDGRTWSFLEPMRTRTDQEAMESYVVELARANAMSVMLDQPDSLSAFGLDDPLVLIETVNKDGSERTLLIGDRVGGRTQDRYAMVEGIPSVIRVDSKVLAGILEDAVRLVDPRATGIAPSSVKSLVIRGPEGQVEIERDLDRWLARSHGDAEVPANRVDSLIELLTEINGSEVAIFDEYPRELEVGTITLIGYDQRPLDTVRVLRESENDGGRWGLENGDSVIRIHPTLIMVPLDQRDWGLRSQTP